MLNPVCGLCKTEMRCQQNGVFVILGPPDENGWVKSLASDKYRCDQCGASVITSFARETTSLDLDNCPRQDILIKLERNE